MAPVEKRQKLDGETYAEVPNEQSEGPAAVDHSTPKSVNKASAKAAIKKAKKQKKLQPKEDEASDEESKDSGSKDADSSS